jgi:uncharacterized protein YheU (UPF0270 family)
MIIPIDELPSATLDAIIEEFVLREGTEYGADECSLAEKIAQVKNQLLTGAVVLVFSELYETVNIVPFENISQ